MPPIPPITPAMIQQGVAALVALITAIGVLFGTLQNAGLSPDQLSSNGGISGSSNGTGNGGNGGNGGTGNPGKPGPINGKPVYYDRDFKAIEGPDGYVLTGFTTAGKNKAERTRYLAFPDTYNGKPIVEIGDTFNGYGARINWITRWPKDLKIIGRSAFVDNELRSIPKSWGKVKQIRDWAFQSNELESYPSTRGIKMGRDVFGGNPVTS